MEASKNEASESSKPSSSLPGDRKSEPQLKLVTTTTSASSTTTTASNITTNVAPGLQDSSSTIANQRRTPTPPKRNSITSLDAVTPAGTTPVTSATESSVPSNPKGNNESANANSESLTSKKAVAPPLPTNDSTTTSSSSIAAATTAASKPNTVSTTSGAGQPPPPTTSSHSYSQHYKVGPMVVAMKRSSSDMQSPLEPKTGGTSSRGEHASATGDSSSGGGSDPKRKKIRKENKSEASDDHKPGRSRASSNKPKVTFAGMPTSSGKLSMTGKAEIKYFGENDAEKESSASSTANPALSLGSGNSIGTNVPTTSAADTQDKTESSTHGTSSSGGNGNNSNGSGLKVPPIKIVLQSHLQSHNGSSASNTTNESENSNSRGHDGHSQGSSGFPYVVSSTTESGSFESNKAKETVSSPPAVSSSDSALITTSGSGSITTSAPTVGSGHTPATSVVAATVSSTSIAVATSATPTSLVPGPTTASIAVTSISTPAPPPARLPPKSAGERKGLPPVAVTISSSQPSGTTTQKEEKERASKSNTSALASASATAAVTSSASTASVSSFTSSSTNMPATSEATNATQDAPVSTVATPAAPQPQPPQAAKEKEKPHRVTRSSQRIATHHGHGSHANASAASTVGPNSPMNGSSPKTSACPSPSNPENADTASTGSGQAKSDTAEKMDTSENTLAVPSAELHPRKRKIKTKDPATAGSSSSSTSGDANDITAATPGQTQEQPVLNCFEMFLNIRKQIDRRRKNMFPVQPKPPQGFKDYLMNRGTYVLANTANARLAVPFLNPPQAITSVPLKELFVEQEKVRHKLRLQHLVEKEKLVLSVEQEILRVHGRAARALSNQAVPFSVCTILKDNEVYNLLTPEQEEKDRNARSRYNGRLFISWLQDVDDKWDKIKESMLLRHHNESESLHAVQKMDWEWKLKEVGLCEPKSTATIDEHHVPMVHVSDDFDLRP